MDCLNEFLHKLYIYLVGKGNDKTNIIRIHTRKLQECGELSFPLNINNWRSLIHECSLDVSTIFDFLSCEEKDLNIDKLISSSQSWNLKIIKCQVVKDNLFLYLTRNTTYRTVISEVCEKKEKYGTLPICKMLNINVKCDIPSNESRINLSELRLKLLVNTTKNLIHFCGGAVVEDGISNISINFSLKSNELGNCLCGPVLNNKGAKDVTTKADDFYNQRTIDMRLMAEHKYGIRITSQVGWKEFLKKLGDAAVIIELLQNKPNHTVTVDENNKLLSSSKGAAFILYNCARLATLFKQFDRKVSLNIYPELPNIEEIDFSLLVQPEEWELLYVYILQFPCTIRNCMRNIPEAKVYPNCLIAMLSKMCLCFSVYYRRVKILTEPKQHIYPTLFARIYLLKALEQVLHNGLKILDIEPVKQM